MKVAVVILNYNGKKFLEQFLPNVIANCDPTMTEIVVADNDSSDGSVAFMQERFPNIRLIENGSNGGFATGYNLALRQIEAQYYVLLNSDIEVAPHWIEPIIELMDADPQIAACQPKILSYYHKALSTSTAIRSVAGVCSKTWRPMGTNTMIRRRCFGRREPVFSSAPTCTIRLAAWMTVSSPTWRKSTCVGG